MTREKAYLRGRNCGPEKNKARLLLKFCATVASPARTQLLKGCNFLLMWLSFESDPNFHKEQEMNRVFQHFWTVSKLYVLYLFEIRGLAEKTGSVTESENPAGK